MNSDTGGVASLSPKFSPIKTLPSSPPRTPTSHLLLPIAAQFSNDGRPLPSLPSDASRHESAASPTEGNGVEIPPRPPPIVISSEPMRVGFVPSPMQSPRLPSPPPARRSFMARGKASFHRAIDYLNHREESSLPPPEQVEEEQDNRIYDRRRRHSPSDSVSISDDGREDGRDDEKRDTIGAFSHEHPLSEIGTDIIHNRPLTVAERLQPTLDSAQCEREKSARRARWTGLAVNFALAALIIFGALTTGLSAGFSGRSTSLATSVFGALITILASYLARVRGSNEPELSRARAKDLGHFIRDLNAAMLDRGRRVSSRVMTAGYHPDDQSEHDELDVLVDKFRKRFEGIMGNTDREERKLSPPA